MNNIVEELLTDARFRKFVLNPNQGDGPYWELWCMKSEEHNKAYKVAKSILINFYEPLPADEFHEEAIKFKRAIDITNADKKDIVSLYENRRQAKSSLYLRVVAAVILLISSIFLFNWLKFDNSANGLEKNGPSTHIIQKVAGKGQKLNLIFKDGTRVKLNSGSSISYPEEFSKSNREVTLSGEAFFEVAHYDHWPFLVKAKNATTRVLGTTFNINAYLDSPEVEVALVQGKVEIQMKGRTPVKLMPKKMARIHVTSEEINVVDFDPMTVTAWKDNKIIFEKAGFDEVQSTLERWYDVKFVYEHKPYFEGGYTGVFADQSLENVLMGMSAGKFHYKIQGNEVLLN